MPTNLTTYRCLIISPSDVAEERDVIEKVIAEWNAHIGSGLEARIEAIRWESHARPEMGAEPQAIINRQLVDDSDFGIAIFWSRLGSPTREYESGSAEEIERLLAKGSRVMVYFCARPVPQDAALDPQFAQLQELKQKYKEQGLLGSYCEARELETIANLHITSLMTQLLLKTRASDQPIPATGSLTAPTPDIRVTTRAALIFQGAYRENVLSIGVENHSPVRFFARQVTLETASGAYLFFPRDLATSEFNRPKVLEPGDSFDFHIPADREAFWGHVNSDRPVCAVVTDKIGRRFRGSPADLASALNALRDRQR